MKRDGDEGQGCEYAELAAPAEELEQQGMKPQAKQILKLHGPVGLDIGAETPEEIALAVAAEIQAELAGRSGGHLKERVEPLHDWRE